MQPDPDDVHVCRICRRPLDLHQFDGKRWWDHTSIDQPADHEPEPVPLATTGGEMVGVCDFCTAPGPRWSYPCANFTIEMGNLPGYASVGDWSACGDCHRAIQRKDWAKVAERAVAAHRQGMPPDLARTFIRKLHRGFRANRTGEPTKLY